jgi:4-alpha-glucanotransferase
VTAIPELAETPSAPHHARERHHAPHARARCALALDARRWPRTTLLAALHRAFTRPASRSRPPPGRRIGAIAAPRFGASRLATYVTLEAHPGRDWRRWPRYRDPASSAVAQFRNRHAEAVDRAMWIQFELDRQLAAVAARADHAGSPSASIRTPLGSAARAATPGRFRDSFVLDGAQSRARRRLAPAGQNWDCPPLDPHAIRADGIAVGSACCVMRSASAGAPHRSSWVVPPVLDPQAARPERCLHALSGR